MNRTTILTVIDGLGLREATQGNAFALAKTPTFDEYFKNYPSSIIQASGEYVGLPHGQMGNSEVGHLNIGAGEIVFTGLSLIQNAIDKKIFKTNPALLKAFMHAKKNNSTLNIMGLLSDGGVHSLEKHLFLILDAAQAFGLKKVSVHAFGDGRDVAPQSIIVSLKKLVKKLNDYDYDLASISGRFYAMDRDQMFDRNEKAFSALIGKTRNEFTNIFRYIDKSYADGIFDEFIEPAINRKAKVEFLGDNDAIIFFNFRPDRARQISHMILNSNLYLYKCKTTFKNICFTSMMKYEGLKTEIAFDEMEVKTPLGQVIADNGLSQLRIAETQKYAHVTFFMDGGKDIIYPNSNRIMVPSLKIDSYADAPEMSAKGITDKLLENIGKYDLIIMNYANPDMVGHTGNLKAAIKAVEVLDFQLGRIKKVVDRNLKVTQFITSDHGNAEITEDKNGNPSTKHTSSPVMLISTDKKIELKDGKLANIAPTILEYMNLKKSDSMNEESLIKKIK
jgi:2,3-bisphosphoglycerate-independent phosphoglycerate mutase